MKIYMIFVCMFLQDTPVEWMPMRVKHVMYEHEVMYEEQNITDVCMKMELYENERNWNSFIKCPLVNETLWPKTKMFGFQSIGADSTGATGACAPVLIKEPGQRSPFSPVTFRESTMALLHTRLCLNKCFRLSVTPSVRWSVHLEMLRGCIQIDVWAFNTLGLNPAHSLVHLCWTYDFNKRNKALKPASAYER